MNRIQSLDDYLDHIEEHHDELTGFLEADVSHAHLTQLAASDEPLTPPKLSIWERVKKIGWVDLRELHGKAYVDPTLKQDVGNKANIIGGTNFINILPAVPIIAYPFSNLGWFGYGLSGGFSVVLLGLTNWVAQRAVTERPREKKGGKATPFGLVLLQLTVSVVSIPGSIMLLDKQELAVIWADTQVEQKLDSDRKAGEEQVKVLTQHAVDSQRDCQVLTDKLSQVPQNSDAADRYFFSAWGAYRDLGMDRSGIETEALQGICWVAKRYDAQAKEAQSQLEAEQLEAKRFITENGALHYLQEHYPELYALHFTPQGTIASGTRTTKLATQTFARKLRQRDLGSLVIPLLFFSLSCTTSSLVVVKLLTYRKRTDVLRSFDPRIALFRDELFHRAQVGVLKRQKQLEWVKANLSNQPPHSANVVALDENNPTVHEGLHDHLEELSRTSQYHYRLLALHHHAAKESGEFAFPPFVDLVERWETLVENISLRKSNEPYPWGECNLNPTYSSQIDVDTVSEHIATIKQRATNLQKNDPTKTDVLEIQQAILALAQETRQLESHFYHAHIKDEQALATAKNALDVIRYVRMYLLSKYSSLEFIGVQRMEQDNAELYQAHQDRCFKYLTDLQNAVNILSELIDGVVSRDLFADKH